MQDLLVEKIILLSLFYYWCSLLTYNKILENYKTRHYIRLIDIIYHKE